MVNEAQRGLRIQTERLLDFSKTLLQPVNAKTACIQPLETLQELKKVFSPSCYVLQWYSIELRSFYGLEAKLLTGQQKPKEPKAQPGNKAGEGRMCSFKEVTQFHSGTLRMEARTWKKKLYTLVLTAAWVHVHMNQFTFSKGILQALTFIHEKKQEAVPKVTCNLITWLRGRTVLTSYTHPLMMDLWAARSMQNQPYVRAVSTEWKKVLLPYKEMTHSSNHRSNTTKDMSE